MSAAPASSTGPGPAPGPAPAPCAGAAPRRWPARLALLLLGVLLDLLWLPPGTLGLHLPALVLVADAPLLLLLWQGGGQGWKRWALLYGAVRFAVALPWLLEVGALQYVGAVVILAPVYVLLGLALRGGARAGLPFVLLVGLGVVLEELLRTVWMGGMPWPQRSLGLCASERLCASAALAGAYGLSFLAGMTSAVAAGLWGVARLPAGLRGPAFLRVARAGLLPAAWAGLLLLHGAERLAHVDGAVLAREAALTPRLLAVQGAVPQSLKHAGHARAANQLFNRHTTLTQAALAEAQASGTRVLAVLWPETMVPWPFLSDDLSRRFPAEWTNQNVIVGRLRDTVPTGTAPPWFLVGAIWHAASSPEEVHEHPDEYLDYDSLLMLDVRGAPAAGAPPPPPPAPGGPPPAWRVARHDKVVRVPGGEYTPLGEWIPPLRVFRDALSAVPEIARGDDRQTPFPLWQWVQRDPGGKEQVHAVRAGTVICFEVAFPQRCRAWRRAHCQVLINAANYGWFGATGFRAQIRAVAALRAAELGMTLVMAGNTGPTRFFDPAGRGYGTFHEVALTPEGLLPEGSDGRGRPLAVAPDDTTHRTGWVLEHLVADDTVTAYAAWGDLPWYLLAGLTLLAGLRRGRAGASGPPPGAVPPPAAGVPGGVR